MNRAESQAFQAGYMAYHDYKSLDDNPFPAGTPQDLWKDGFLVARIVYNSESDEYPLALHKSLGINYKET